MLDSRATQRRSSVRLSVYKIELENGDCEEKLSQSSGWWPSLRTVELLCRPMDSRVDGGDHTGLPRDLQDANVQKSEHARRFSTQSRREMSVSFRHGCFRTID